jgi:hypothetical protein
MPLTQNAGNGYFKYELRELKKNIKLFYKAKESRNRPGVAQSVPGDLGSQIS